MVGGASVDAVDGAWLRTGQLRDAARSRITGRHVFVVISYFELNAYKDMPSLI